MADDKPANFGNSGDWWTTTKAHPDIFRPAYQNAENDQIIRDTVGIDPALLVSDLHVSEIHIRAYQKKLGVRKLTGNDRWAALTAVLGRDLFAGDVEQVTVDHGIQIDGILFLPAVYRAA